MDVNVFGCITQSAEGAGGSDEATAEFRRLLLQDAAYTQAACSFIARAAGIGPVARAQLVENGAVCALLRAMRTYRARHGPTMCAACGACVQLFADAGAREQFLANGLIDTLDRTLAYSRRVPVVKAATHALAVFVHATPQFGSKVSARFTHVWAVASRVLGLFADECDDVAVHASMLVARLATDPAARAALAQDPLVQDNLCTTLARLSGSRLAATQARVRLAVWRAVAHLNVDPACAAHFAHAGVCARMCDWARDARVDVDSALTVLRMVVGTSMFPEYDAMLDACEAPQLSLVLLERHGRAAPELANEACRGVANFSTTPEAALRMREHGAIEQVLLALDTFGAHDASVAQSACYALSNLLQAGEVECVPDRAEFIVRKSAACPEREAVLQRLAESTRPE